MAGMCWRSVLPADVLPLCLRHIYTPQAALLERAVRGPCMMRAAANQTDPRLSVIAYYNLSGLTIDSQLPLSLTRRARGASKVSLL